jgi:predicted nucleic acid-binding protein
MEEFYKNRELDFAKWLEINQLLIENNRITPKEIFEHAYTLGALYEVKSRNGEI